MKARKGTDQPRIDAPDVTHAVMTRLGFQLVSRQDARRARIRRGLLRGVTIILFLALAVITGLHERRSPVANGTTGGGPGSDRSQQGQASLLGGLVAPLEELERLLEFSEASEAIESTEEIDPGFLHGPTRGARLMPLIDDESGPFASFPRS